MAARRIASLLALVLALALSAPPIPAEARANLATASISRMDTAWWRTRFEAKQAALAARKPALVWLGDSITQDWEINGDQSWNAFAPIWNRFYGARDAANLGFNGDSTCHVLWRLEHGELAALGQPRALVLLIGANNFGLVHTDARQTFDGIQSILTLLRSHLPKTRIIVIGVLPSIRSPWVTANTRALNAELARAIPAHGMTEFVDASPIFEADGKVQPDRFLDPHLVPPGAPLHPTSRSQEKIAALIEPLIVEAGFPPLP